MEQLQKLTKEQIIEQEMGAVYDFFVQAELAGEHFSYKKMCKVYPHDIKTIRKYAQNYWSWFLIKESKTKPFTFSCRGLANYPRPYFIDAHKPDQGQYFYHFAVALQDAAVRVEERRRKRVEAKALAEQLPLPVINEEQETMIAQQEATETLVPEQVVPEYVHIEAIDDDLEENGESDNESSPLAGAATDTSKDEHLPGGDNLSATDHHSEDGATEQEIPVVPIPVTVAYVPQEAQALSSGRDRQEGKTGTATGKLVAAVCLVVLVGLAVWWVASKR